VPVPLIERKDNQRFPIKCIIITQIMVPISCATPRNTAAVYLSMGAFSFANITTAKVCRVDVPPKEPIKKAVVTRMKGK